MKLRLIFIPHYSSLAIAELTKKRHLSTMVYHEPDDKLSAVTYTLQKPYPTVSDTYLIYSNLLFMLAKFVYPRIHNQGRTIIELAIEIHRDDEPSIDNDVVELASALILLTDPFRGNQIIPIEKVAPAITQLISQIKDCYKTYKVVELAITIHSSASRKPSDSVVIQTDDEVHSDLLKKGVLRTVLHSFYKTVQKVKELLNNKDTIKQQYNHYLFIKSYMRSFTTDTLDRITLTMEIDRIFQINSRGVRPLRKDELQREILNDRLPDMEEILYSKYKVDALPEPVYSQLMMDSSNGWVSTTIVDDPISGKWIHVYETSNPGDNLLLMGVTNMLLRKHVIRRLLIPINLTKMDSIRDSHYQFLNLPKYVEGVIVVNLKPEQFNRADMIKNLHNVCHSRNGLIGSICEQYIRLPVYDIIQQELIQTPTLPPLGDITSCLYHILYQNVFDREVAEKFPDLLYSRWENEIVIINEFNAKRRFEYEDVCDILKELNLQGDCTVLYANEDSQMDKYNMINTLKDPNRVLYLHGRGRLSVERLMEDDSD